MSPSAPALVADEAPHVPRAHRHWVVVAAALIVSGWGANQFTPLLVMYRSMTDGDGARLFTPVTVDGFLAAYVVGLVPGLLVGGPASDRYGRRVLVPGTALAALGSVILGSAAFVPPEWPQLPLYFGRFITGIAAGLAMAVGTSWVKELSQAPFDPRADAGAGARRASLSLTVGFGAGAGVAGALAQWGPGREWFPYLVQVAVSVPVIVLLLRVPETAPARIARGSWAEDLHVPLAFHPRFLWSVAPMAPWVFGAAGIAYAVLPQLQQRNMGRMGLAFSTLLTVVTLLTGVLVQGLAKRLDTPRSGRATIAGLGLIVAGLALASWAARSIDLGAPVVVSIGWTVLAAMVLGAAYGVCLVSGLQEVQRIASPTQLAGLTAVYYALTYLGFLLPLVLSTVAGLTSYGILLLVLAGLAGVSLVLVACHSVRALPCAARPDAERKPHNA